MTQQEKETRMIELAEEYYYLIINDHHKDRDCHFYITKIWSYGETPEWVAHHEGYLNEFEESFGNYQAALEFMLEQILLLINKEKERMQNDG